MRCVYPYYLYRDFAILIIMNDSLLWAYGYFGVQTMYKGVLRDDERRKEKMKQRQLEFEESQRKRAVYESVQKVETEGAIPSGGSR